MYVLYVFILYFFHFRCFGGGGWGCAWLTISPEVIMIWCITAFCRDYSLLKSSSCKEETTWPWQGEVMHLLKGGLLKKAKSGALNFSIHEDIFHWISYISNDPYESNRNKNRFEIYCSAAIINTSGEHRHIPWLGPKSFIRRSHFTFECFKGFCLFIST